MLFNLILLLKDHDCAITHSLLPHNFIHSSWKGLFVMNLFLAGNPSFPKYFKCFTWTEERVIQKPTNVDRVLDTNKVICDINNYTYSIQNSFQLQIT